MALLCERLQQFGRAVVIFPMSADVQLNAILYSFLFHLSPYHNSSVAVP